MPLRRAVAGVARKMQFRNGRGLREMLPLWKGNGRGMPLRRAEAWVPGKMQFRNGRGLRDLLPLW